MIIKNIYGFENKDYNWDLIKSKTMYIVNNKLPFQSEMN